MAPKILKKKLAEVAANVSRIRRLNSLNSKKENFAKLCESAESDSEQLWLVLSEASAWMAETQKTEPDLDKAEWALDLSKLAYKSVRSQNTAALKLFFLSGLSLEEPVYQRTLLSHAAAEGKMESLKALVALGAKINEGAGESARGDLNPKEDVFAGKGETGLIAAAHAGMTEAFVWLLENGADIGKADIRKLTPLHWAVSMNRMEIARVLVLSGAKSSSVDKDGWTPLMKLASKGWSAGVAALIIEASRREGCLEAANRQGLTAAHLSCRASTPELLRMLIVAGAEVDKKDGSGFSAMQRSREAPWSQSWYAEYEKTAMETMFAASGELDESKKCKRPAMRL